MAKDDEVREQANAFIGMLQAAMKDAAINRKLTQLKVTITPEETKRQTFIRIIVVPETMDMEWAKPLRTS